MPNKPETNQADKIQLAHPDGKKPVRMDTDKYELLKAGIIEYLTKNGTGSFSDMYAAIQQNLTDKNIPFDGSVKWHLEWVKLDLEAKKSIYRVHGTAPQTYAMAKQT